MMLLAPPCLVVPSGTKCHSDFGSQSIARNRSSFSSLTEGRFYMNWALPSAQRKRLLVRSLRYLALSRTNMLICDQIARATQAADYTSHPLVHCSRRLVCPAECHEHGILPMGVSDTSPPQIRGVHLHLLAGLFDLAYILAEFWSSNPIRFVTCTPKSMLLSSA